MNTLRNTLGIAICLLLTVGYAASQLAYFQGNTAEYAKKVDTQPIKYLALALLVACVVLAFIPTNSKSDGGSKP